MSRIQRTDSASIQSSADQPLAISAEDGVKVSVALSADGRGFTTGSSTVSLRPSFGGVSTALTGGTKKLPAVDGDPAQYKLFRATCDAILREVRRLKAAMHQTALPDDWMTTAAEIEGLVQELYDVAWGEKDALKRVVVKIESQINNAVWDHRHVGFLEDVFVNLRHRFSINDLTVGEIADLVKSHGLPLFRGSLSAGNLRKRFKLVEIESEGTDE